MGLNDPPGPHPQVTVTLKKFYYLLINLPILVRIVAYTYNTYVQM